MGRSYDCPMPWTICPPALALAAAIAPLPSPIELQIDISALATMPPRQLQGMTREASEIWKSHGVALTWLTAERELPRGTRPVLKVVDAPPAAATASSRLGSIVYREGHMIPEHTLELVVETIGRLVEDTPWVNRRVRDWPPSVRSMLIGRALGRVLAHEIGHYLFAWRTHTDHGLMRQSFRRDLLVDPD